MAYHPENHTMDVILPDGTLGIRPVSHVDRFDAVLGSGRRLTFNQYQPELHDGEELRWTVSSDVPYIVQVRESGPLHFDPSFGSYEGF